MSKRSKDLISESLITLLENNTFNEITIQQICDNTDVTRKTFYNNFDSKVEALGYYINKLVLELIEVLKEQNNPDPRLMSYTYFAFWHKHETLLKYLINNSLFYILQDKLEDKLQLISSLVLEVDEKNKARYEYIYNFFASGLTLILKMWTNNNFRESYNEMSYVFDAISNGL